MRACLGIPGKPCARLTSAASRCPTCKREFARQRKAKGLTGERGSTHASRKRRERVLERAKVNGVPRCFYCRATGASIADHFIPRAAGGPDTESNLVAACVPCNSAKADKMPSEFMESTWLAERCRDVAGRRDAA